MEGEVALVTEQGKIEVSLLSTHVATTFPALAPLVVATVRAIWLVHCQSCSKKAAGQADLPCANETVDSGLNIYKILNLNPKHL